MLKLVYFSSFYQNMIDFYLEIRQYFRRSANSSLLRYSFSWAELFCLGDYAKKRVFLLSVLIKQQMVLWPSG